MQFKKVVLTLLGTLGPLTLGGQLVRGQGEASASPVQTHVVITDMALLDDSELPRVHQENVKVKQGRVFSQVRQLIPAEGDNAALQLMILIDETLHTSIGNNLGDIRDFINGQPPTTVTGVGYMSNAGVNVVQNSTAGWPQQNVQSVVLMITDGIDRLRAERPQPSRLGPGFGPVYHSMPTMSPDAASASETSQRYNVIVYAPYAVGVGRTGRSSWDLQLGLSGLTKIADETGGECLSLGTSNPVSFKPYLESLQKYLASRYYLVFLAVPRKRAGFRRINVPTEVANSEIAAPDNVWVPAEGN